jgi:2'-5' RNA ligase
MFNRAIVIFPQFSNIRIINEIRKRYDPLADYIAPHITLVFPFESDIPTNELIEYIKFALAGFDKFNLAMCGITGNSDGYIFLDVKTGNDKIIELHDKLYKGLLKEHHNRFIPYIPHLTLGRLKDVKQHQEIVASLFAFDEIFEIEVVEVVVERIDEEEKSIIEYVHKF